MILCAGCATGRSKSNTAADVRKLTLADLDPGAILITPSSQPAKISFDPPNNHLESAGEGAAAATRSVLDTPNLGHPQLEAAVGVIEFAAVPFAAAYGAARASHHRLSPAQLVDSQHDLLFAMQTNAGSVMLRDKVADAARQRTHRLLLCAASLSTVPTNREPISARLEITAEQLDLKISPTSHNQYALSIAARARLFRISDEIVLFDRRYHYQSGSAFFVDWADPEALDSVAQTAYQILADQIADDLFQPVSEPPLLIGPGHEHSRLSSSPPPHLHVAQTSESAVSQASSLRTSLRSDAALSLPPRLPRSPKTLLALSLRSMLADRRLWALELTNAAGGNTETGIPANKDVAPVLPTNSAPPNLLTISVYLGKPDDRLRAQTPAPEPASSPGDQTETEWKMDGLENDRNAVVQAISCIAALPLGLWEQTAGAFGRHSREQAEQLTRSLNDIPEQTHFDDLVADTVARRLRSQTINSVQRTDESVLIGLTNLTPLKPQESAPSALLSNKGIALEIQMLDARLIPQKRHGQSMSLAVDVQATILRASDGQEIYSRPIHYCSFAKPIKDWAAADAKLFRKELEASSRETAEALALDLIGHGFVTPNAPMPPTTQ